MTTQIMLPTMPATLEDWDALREADPEHIYELVEGDIRIMTPPKFGHSRVVTQIMAWLLRHGVDPDLIHAGAGLATGHNGRVPDLMVLTQPVPDDTRHVDGILVALAIEVVSPSTASEDRYVKPAEYARAGIAEYWIIDGATSPDAATVTVFELIDSRYVNAADRVSLPAVLASPPSFISVPE